MVVEVTTMSKRGCLCQTEDEKKKILMVKENTYVGRLYCPADIIPCDVYPQH